MEAGRVKRRRLSLSGRIIVFWLVLIKKIMQMMQISVLEQSFCPRSQLHKTYELFTIIINLCRFNLHFERNTYSLCHRPLKIF